MKTARAERLRDTGVNAPRNWEFPFGTPRVHVAVTVYAATEDDWRAEVAAYGKELGEVPGVRLLSHQDFAADGYNVFGYRDGFSQPVVEGSGAEPLPGDGRPIKAGEFVLGHPSETGVPLSVPAPDVLGRNGTYVVFRKYHSHVAAFNRAAAKALTRMGRPLPPAVETLAAANHHILGETFHSMAALRYGDHVAKISAAPRSANVRALTGRPVEKKAGESALRDLVVDFFAHNSAEYDIRAQLCTDIDRMPVEDASVLWPEELSPHEVVGVLHLPAQDAYSDARRRYADDVLSFSPWHALEAHRPLGSVMRSRRAAYPSSSDFRHRLNGVDPQEPASVKELPA
ncbi:hypothetical protein [Streptomyces sp. NPDC127114]|uniref:hypothetical protein n=1 Tax=Streptomyces sp. NPDC127114 TaxID=3345366 RepID=UPI003638C157